MRKSRCLLLTIPAAAPRPDYRHRQTVPTLQKTLNKQHRRRVINHPQSRRIPLITRMNQRNAKLIRKLQLLVNIELAKTPPNPFRRLYPNALDLRKLRHRSPENPIKTPKLLQKPGKSLRPHPISPNQLHPFFDVRRMPLLTHGDLLKPQQNKDLLQQVATKSATMALLYHGHIGLKTSLHVLFCSL